MSAVWKTWRGCATLALCLIEVPQPLPPELLPVEPFPMAALPDAFGPWVRDVAERMHCPPDFVAVPLLVAARFAGGAACRHPTAAAHRLDRARQPVGADRRPTRHHEIARHVAGPGADGSPGGPRSRGIQRPGRAASGRGDGREVAYRGEREGGAGGAQEERRRRRGGAAGVPRTQRDAPTRSRYVVNDLTYEKLGEILSANPDGVLSVRDEMRGLFLSLAREESAPARAFYLQAWSGGSYTFDRIGRGTVTVDDARLSIIGGIQPGPLSELVQQARRGAADDGMIERFLIAWPDAPGEWREVDRWPDTEGKRRAWEAFERLDTLTAGALGAERETDIHGDPRGLPFVRFDDDAREAFGEWRTEFEHTIRSAEGEGLEGALSKFRHHVPALALGAACDRRWHWPCWRCPRRCARWRWPSISRATQDACIAVVGA